MYQSEMYGDVEIRFNGGKLSQHFGPNFNGDLEHWNYDTFQVSWRDKVQGKGLVIFSLNAKGSVDGIDLGGMGKFKRQPDKK